MISGMSSKCRAFKENFKEVTCNIMNLYTNLKIAEDVAQIARTLFNQLIPINSVPKKSTTRKQDGSKALN